MAMEYVNVGGCCDDCLMIIANDDASGMDDATEAKCREGIHRFTAHGQYLVAGDELGFSWSRCDVCNGLAGNRTDVGYLTEKGQQMEGACTN